VEGGGCRDDHVFEKQVCTQLTRISLTIIPHTGSKRQRNRVRTNANQLPALYLLLRAGAGVDAEIGRAYEVLLTRPPLSFNPTPCICLLDMWATASVVVVVGCCRW